MAISKSNPHERVKAIIRSVMPVLKRNPKVPKKMEKPPKLAVSSLTRSEVHDILGLSKDPRSAEIWKMDEADVIPVPPEVCKYYLSHYFI